MLRIFLYLFIVIKNVCNDLIYFDAICFVVVLAHLFFNVIFPQFYFGQRNIFSLPISYLLNERVYIGRVFQTRFKRRTD